MENSLDQYKEFISSKLNELEFNNILNENDIDNLKKFWQEYIKVSLINSPQIAKGDVTDFDKTVLETLAQKMTKAFENDDNKNFEFDLGECKVIEIVKKLQTKYTPKSIEQEKIYADLVQIRNNYIKRMAKIEGIFLFDLVSFIFKYTIIITIILGVLYFTNEKVKNILNEQLKLDSLLNIEKIIPNKEVKKDKLYSLSVNAEPRNSTIKIKNIGPKFKQGIQLKEGSYHIEVSYKGYKTHTQWIKLSKDTTLSIKLKK